MKELVYKLPSIIFNCIEAVCICSCGILFNLQHYEILTIIIVFVITRMTAKKPCHYKSTAKCFIWTILVFCSLFLIVKVNITVSLIITMFSAYVLTEKGNIKLQDAFMYKKENKEKYREMKEYIQKHQNEVEIKRFEQKLKKIHEIYSDRYKVNFYEIYVLKFKEDKTFSEIKELTEIYDNHAVIKILDMIFISFNIYMDDIGKLDKLTKKEDSNTEGELAITNS